MVAWLGVATTVQSQGSPSATPGPGGTSPGATSATPSATPNPTSGPNPTATLIPQQEIDFRYFSTGLDAGRDRAAVQEVIIAVAAVLPGMGLATLIDFRELLKRPPPAPPGVSPPTPNSFKTITTTTPGDLAAWTPPTGKRFRLVHYSVIVSSDADLGVADTLAIELKDASGSFQKHFVEVPTPGGAAGGTPLYDSGEINLGEGYAPSAANDALKVSLSTHPIHGWVRLHLAGIEE